MICGWSDSQSGSGHKQFFNFSSILEVEASYSLITWYNFYFSSSTFILFNLGSTYSYVSSYYAICLGLFRYSLSMLMHAATPRGYPLVLD